MKHDPDSLFDRRRLKRRLSFWRSLAVVALVALAVGVAQLAVGELPALGRTDHVARLSLAGFITEDRELTEAVENIADDPAAKALLVYIDSPGGTVVGGETLFAALRKVAAAKPVVAVMGSTATSAGYMVALGADRVFARAGTITGSIGVILQTADITELLKSLGIQPTAIKSAPLKAVPSPLEPLTPEGRQAAQALVNETYAMFVEMVRERRSLSPEHLAEVTDGRVFTGRQALAKGLVDELGGEEEARVWLERERQVDQALPVLEIELEDDIPWLFSLTSALIGKRFLPERLRLDGLIAVWHPDLRL